MNEFLYVCLFVQCLYESDALIFSNFWLPPRVFLVATNGEQIVLVDQQARRWD